MKRSPALNFRAWVLIAVSWGWFATHLSLAQVRIRACDDLALDVFGNPFDMSDSADINNFLPGSDVYGLANPSWSGGMFSATVTQADATLHLWSPVVCGAFPVGGRYGANYQINTNKYDQFSIRLCSDQADAGGMRLVWERDCGYVPQRTITQPLPLQAGCWVYSFNLKTEVAIDPAASGVLDGWAAGSITGFGIMPSMRVGASIQIDWIKIEDSTSCDYPRVLAVRRGQDLSVQVNEPPNLTLYTPNHEGADAVRPWNMNSGDFVLNSNMNEGNDAAYSGEKLTQYLPDSRWVSGERGDMFKGTNSAGIPDPANFLAFTGSSNLLIDASQYRNLCFKLLVDRSFSLANGSVARIFWRNPGGAYKISEDIVLITNGWSDSKWFEYCTDLSKLYLDGTLSTGWSGNVDLLRLDPHEFSSATTYYFDRVKLRKDFQADGQFLISFELADSDDAASAALYYTTNPIASGGQPIGNINEGQRSLAWNTSALPQGTYYVYGVANDGLNTTSRLATGKVIVSHAAGLSGQPPILSLETPLNGSTACGQLQAKGYALHPDRREKIAVVEVYIDGGLVGATQPHSFSPRGRADYPQLDSSDSGFNAFFDVSALTLGSHTVEIRALANTGESTSSGLLSFTRQNANCPAAISDPEPGQPIPPSEGTPTPGSQASRPKIKQAKLSKSGVLTLKVAKAIQKSSSCNLAIKLGLDATNVDRSVKQIAAQKALVELSAKGIKIDRKKIPNFYLTATKNCSGYAARVSAVKKIKVTTNGKIKTLQQLAKKLAKLKLKS